MRKKIVQIPGKFYFLRETLPVALKRVHGKIVTHPHDYTGVPHWHDFSELVIVTGGSGLQNINGTVYPVSRGDVFVITGKTTHFFENYRNLEITNIMYSERIFRDLREYLKRIPGYHVVFRFEPELRGRRAFHNTLHLSPQALAHVTRTAGKMNFELERGEPGCEAAVLALLFELIVFLSRSLDDPGSSRHSVTRLAGLFSTLEASFQEDWPLERMAGIAGMSVNTLLRTFQAVAKQTPLQYLTALRMNAACTMLETSDRSVSEIAFLCGFHDSNYFTKRFHAQFHQSPGKWRRECARR